MKKIYLALTLLLISLLSACSSETIPSENLTTSSNTTEEHTTNLTLPILLPHEIPVYTINPTPTYEISTRYMLGIEWTCFDGIACYVYDENNNDYLRYNITNDNYYLIIPHDDNTNSEGFVLVYIESEFHVLYQFGNYSYESVTYKDGIVSYGNESFILSNYQQTIFENYFFLFN